MALFWCLEVLSLIAVSLSAETNMLSSTGVPCYLHPAAAGCHYNLKPGSETCTTPGERMRLNQAILVVNRTLVSLEQQLIRLGIIPPDNSCSELPPVADGGIIYSDLNLAPGASARYICNEGYMLYAFYERFEFNCTDDGLWNGNVTEVPVECQLSSERCESPGDILNGTISYINEDSANTLVGDIITYSCDPGTELKGPSKRFCLRNGNWTEYEPECVDIIVDGPTPVGKHKKDVIGVSVGSTSAVMVLSIVIITTLIVVYKWRSRKRKLNELGSYDDITTTSTSESNPILYSSPAIKNKSPKSSIRSTRHLTVTNEMSL